MMKQITFPFALLMLLLAGTYTVLPAQTTDVVKAIYAEYAYDSIPEDDVTLKMMYGYTRYKMYADDKYLMIESGQYLPPEEEAKMGPGLLSKMVKDIATDKVYLCVRLDTLLIRMEGGEKERGRFEDMTSAYSDTTYNKTVVSKPQPPILGFNNTKIEFRNEELVSLNLYVSTQLTPDASLQQNCPFFLQHDGKHAGFMLGNDQITGFATLHLRAKKVVTNEKIDMAGDLNQYKLVNKEEGNELMKAWFENLMKGKN